MADDSGWIADRDNIGWQVADDDRAAPTTVLSPIVTPGQTITPPPSQTLLPIVIGLEPSHFARLGSGSTGCVAVRSCTFGPICTSSPIVILATSSAIEAPIRECSGSDVDLETVVATERRPDDSAFADASQKSTQDAVPLGIIIAGRGIELGGQKRRAIALSG